MKIIVTGGSIFFFKSKQFEDKGIEIIDNNSEEILEAIVEMEKRLTGKWIQNENEKLLQDKFWHILKK